MLKTGTKDGSGYHAGHDGQDSPSSGTTNSLAAIDEDARAGDELLR